jgi:serine/threonine-protein kinase
MSGKPVARFPATPGAGPAADEVRAQLARILDSKIFVQSERLRRFLSVTVEHALAGQSEGLKEYALGRDVFDRDQSYDPRVDSIVRVEARRLRRKLDEYYGELGEHDPVRIELPKGSYAPQFRYAVVSGPVILPFAGTQSQTLNPRTVAVLPFRNLSPDPGQDYFCEGMGEEILNTLARIPELNVVARTSVFHFKGMTASVREIGQQLGAGTVIEGSVRGAGDRLRISVQAVDAVTGVVIWSGSFDRGVTDVFAVQEEIARAIAESLRVSLLPSPESPARDQRSVEAHNAYLKGCHFWNRVSQEGVDAALSEFQRSLALFPEYAPSHVGLANAFVVLTFWGVLPPETGIARAKQAALEAVRLDGGRSGGYAMLGVVTACCEWHWTEGAPLLRKAIELQPSNMIAYTYYALYLLCQGQFAEARKVLDRSLQLDPLSPWSFRNQGWYFYYQRRYDLAIDALKTSLALDPRYREAQFMLAYAYLRAARHGEAIECLLELPEGPHDATRCGALGEAYACAGNTVEARGALRKLDALAETGYVSPLNRAAIHAGLREWDRMFEEIERAYATRAPWLCLVKVDPRYDAVRSDPRFVHLLERMDLI